MIRNLTTGLLAALLAACAGAPVRDVTDPELPRALPAVDGVDVSWNDPSGFSDLRRSGNRWEARRGDWVRDLAGYLQRGVAARLPPGERAELEITDIRRAGDYEPWLGPDMQDVRMMRDIYWPRIAFRFRRYGADGRLLDEGERLLRDPAYLTSGVRSPATGGPLYYEKRMIDDWLRREFPGRGG